MVTLVWRSDVHLADHAPQSRVDDWNEALLEKLRQVGDIARDVDAQAVFDGGDFFHIKSPTRNTHKLVQKAAQVHADYPCPVYGNVGNHDVKYGDYSFLDESPLGVLFTSGVFRRCYDEHDVTFTCDGVTVRVAGVPYHGVKYDMERFKRIKKGSEDYLVVIAHVLASQKGGSMFEGEDIIRYADLGAFDADVFCFGHWHKNQGVTPLPGDKWVVNVGSLSRGALSQDDLTRVPTTAILRFRPDGISIEERPLKVRPPEEVFDITGRARLEARESLMAAFVDKFQAALDAAQPNVSLTALISSMQDVPDKVKERAIGYVELAGGR